MKSILYQLKKYCPPPEDAVKFTIPEVEEKHREDDLWKLASKIVGSCEWMTNELSIKRVASLLVDMPNSPYVGTLFSKEILGIYHCYYNHHEQVTSEDVTDTFFKEFLQQVDPIEYQRKFDEAVDETAKKLAVVRVMLATSEDESSLKVPHSGLFSNKYYPGGTELTTSTGFVYATTPRKKEDRLPFEFREPAAKYLGIHSIAAAANFQDRTTRYATLDQIILGRMGYMMFWSWNNRGDKSEIPLLEAPRKALSPPKVIYLPAPGA